MLSRFTTGLETEKFGDYSVRLTYYDNTWSGFLTRVAFDLRQEESSKVIQETPLGDFYPPLSKDDLENLRRVLEGRVSGEHVDSLFKAACEKALFLSVHTVQAPAPNFLDPSVRQQIEAESVRKPWYIEPAY